MFFFCVGFLLRPPAAQLSQPRLPHPVRFSGPRLSLEARLGAVVNELKAEGATQMQLEDAFTSVVKRAFAPPPPPPPPSGELQEPSTISEAQKVFRDNFKGRLVTAETQKFLNVMIEDRAVIFRFTYTRVYALGFVALCNVFLKASCRTPEDEKFTRSALCFALGLDEAQVASDAAAVLEEARGVNSKWDLFNQSPEFKAIAAAPTPPKYTYTFGVGLCLLMKALGESNLTAPSKGYGAQAGDATTGAIDAWCKALNLRFSNRLATDYTRPLSIDGCGRFSFDTPERLEATALESIGVEGSF